MLFALQVTILNFSLIVAWLEGSGELYTEVTKRFITAGFGVAYCGPWNGGRGGDNGKFLVVCA